MLLTTCLTVRHGWFCKSMLQTLLQTASCALAAMSHSAPPQSIHTVSCPGLLQGLLHHLSRLTLPALQQGREKDVVIFSAVRTRRRGGIGFVADERRINVGLTRARSSLLVLGNAGALEKGCCLGIPHPPRSWTQGQPLESVLKGLLGACLMMDGDDVCLGRA